MGYLPKLNFIECILLIYYELGTVSIITLEVTGVSAPRPPWHDAPAQGELIFSALETQDTPLHATLLHSWYVRDPLFAIHPWCNDALMDIVVEAEIELSDLVWWKIENLQWMLYPFSEASNNFFTRASILLSSHHLFIWGPMVGWRPHSYSAQWWGQDDAISAISACRGNGPRHHGHRYLRRYVVF